MKRTFFLILLFFCALFVKADVLGPYTMDSNVPPTPTGYARVVPVSYTHLTLPTT